MPVILAIETSQRTGSVAARRWRGPGPGGGRAGEPGQAEEAGAPALTEALSPRLRHDDDLLPAIDRLFRRLAASPRDLAAVGVSIGPGGFTGLRIAVSTAKAFGEALGAAIVGVPSALVAAEAYAVSVAAARPAGAERKASGMILVALCGKGETCWLTRVSAESGSAAIAGDAGLVSAATIDLGGASVMLGDEHMPAAIRERCREAGVPVVVPRFEAAACLAITERCLAAGRTVDPVALLPLYPRQPEAVSLWERRGR